MSSPEDVTEKNPSRRQFIRWAGALAAVGVVGLGLQSSASLFGKQNTEKTTVESTKTVSETSTSTATETETVTVTQTATKTEMVTASGPPKADPTPTTSAQVPANNFSIFWITDTQFLSESNPALFGMLTNWIVSNWGPFNGKMVIHTGDVVQTGAHQAEWKNANEAMSTLLKNGIPYSWCAGNHDNVVQDKASSGWFGSQWAPAFDPAVVGVQVNGMGSTRWVGDYHNGMNTAVSFIANGLKFLVINIEWNAAPDVLNWAAGILQDPNYAECRVIVAPHAYIDAWGSTDDARWGPMLTEFRSGLTALLDAHSSSVFLTLNGHFATEVGYNTTTPINNRNELMFDRQDCTDYPDNPVGRGIDIATSSTSDAAKVGGATVTILTFDTDNNKINVRTYDVYTGKWRENPEEKYAVSMFSTFRRKGGVVSTVRPLSVPVIR